MDYLKTNQDAFVGGAIAVILGLLSKNLMKKEVLPVSGGKQILTTFVVVSAAGLGSNEIKKKYPIQ